MKSIFLLTSLLAASISLAQDPGYVPGDVIVKFRPGADNKRIIATRMLGAKEVKKFPAIGAVRVRIPAGMSVEAAVEYYKNFPDIVYAEPNYLRKLYRTVPNDPLYHLQYGPKRMSGELAWDLTKGSSSTIIAVIDSGVDVNHPDLKPKLLPGRAFPGATTDLSDPIGHGTHCIGIAGAATNNRIGVAGMGFNCRILPLKLSNFSVEAVVESITYATDNGAKVISMSFGGPAYSQAEQDAVTRAFNRGVLPIAAAGNDDSSDPFFIGYPAQYEHVLSVGATNEQDEKADFSNFGPQVDVAAPGDNIYSTYVASYGYSSGTSMSCPMVAGVAGLLYSYGGPGTTPTAVRTALETTSDRVGTWLNYGRVNAYKALLAIAPPVEHSFVPTTIARQAGASSTGDVSSVQTSNNVYFSVNSEKTNLGQVAGIEMSFQITQPLADMRTLNLHMEGQAASGSTNSVFLYNWSTGTWDYYRAFAMSTGDKTMSTSLDIASNYISSTGTVRVIARGNVGGSAAKRNAPFRMRLDHVRLVGGFKSAIN